MGLVVTPIGVFGAFAALVLLALAFAIFRANPSRPQVRSLALLLFVDAAIAVWGTSTMYLTDSVAVVYASQITVDVLLAMEPLAYLLFLGTFPSRFARPLASRPVRVALVLLMPVAGAFVLADESFFLAAVIEGSHSPLDVEAGPGFLLLLAAVLLTNLFGLVIGLHSWRSARPGSSERRKLGLASLAFGVRDGLLFGSIGLALVLAAQGRLEASSFVLFTVMPAVALLLWALLLGYAVLRASVFDIDLKVKLALNRGTIGATFVAVFFVVAKLTETFADRLFGQSWVLGAVAAGLMLFGLRPLERAANRLADKALPGVEDTPAYAQYRKLEVYKATLEELVGDGVVTAKERRALESLRSKLGIATVDAHALERDLAPAARPLT